MPWLCGPLLAVGGGPALSWTFELWPEKWRDTTFSSVRYYGSHGDHFGNPYIWISICGVISVAFLGLNEKDCTIILLTTQVNSGSNRMCFAVKVSFAVLLCSWLQIMFLTIANWAGSYRELSTSLSPQQEKSSFFLLVGWLHLVLLSSNCRKLANEWRGWDVWTGRENEN